MEVISNPTPPEKPKKIKKAVVYEKLVRHMNGHWSGLRDPFQKTYLLVEHHPGVYEPAELISNESKVVRFCSASEIRREVIKWAWQSGPTNDYEWTVDDAKKCVELWQDLTPPIKMPKSACFKSQNDYCFVKHNWDPDLSCKTPVFDEILSRMSNRKAFMAFFGSLFFEDSYKQQYLWLKGSGQDAKGCLTRLIKKILGPSCKSANPPTRGQNPGFWLDNIMKAKAVVFSDIEDRSFVTTGIGKSLTGGDIQSCEKKYGSGYDAVFNGKLIFTSNWTPNISSEHSDQRRIIYCELQEKTDKSIDINYENKLWREAPGIVEKCIIEYQEQCSGGGPIPCSKDQAIEIASDNEDEYHLLMERFVVHGIKEDLPDNQQKYIKETEFTQELRSFFGHTAAKEKAGFKKWLIRNYTGKVIFKAIKIGGKTTRVTLGLQKYMPNSSSGNFLQP